jgi:hypothetical protein
MKKGYAGFSGLWLAYFLLLPFAIPVKYGLVLGDLPALVLISIALIKSASFFRFSATEAWFALLIGISLIGCEVTRVPAFYGTELAALLFLFACGKITADYLVDQHKLAMAIKLVSLSVIAVLIINTAAVSLHNLTDGERAGSFFSTSGKLSWPCEFSGQLGIALNILFPLIFWQRQPTAKRFLLYGMLALNTGAIASRSVFWLSTAEILYLEFFLHGDNKPGKIVAKLLLLLCMAGMLTLYFGESYSFQRSLGQLEKNPLLFDEPRLISLRAALRTLPNWLQGYGLGCFKVFNHYEIHNTPLSLLVETGFIGFFAGCMFLANIFMIFWRSPERGSPLWHVLLLSLIALAITSLFRNLVTSRVSWFILALCWSHRHLIPVAADDSQTRELKLQPAPQ